MIDIKLIRENPAWVQEQLIKLNDTNAPIAEILQLDEQRRVLLQEVEELRRVRKIASKEIGQQMGQLQKLEKQLAQAMASGAEVNQLRVEVEAARLVAENAKDKPRQMGERISEIEEELRQVETELYEKMLWVPNMPHESVPFGTSDKDNINGEPQGAPLPTFTFTPQPHWELGTALDIIDFERGTKLSGSRFYLLKGLGARLQRAIIRFMLDLHVDKHGYTEIYPPFMVRAEMFVGAGQLPKFADNIYRDAEEDFMFLGTAEIALTNLHRDEILEEASLPLNYVAYTPCFRREKMSAGRDVRGIKRGHQFDKVEMYKFVHPDTSYAELEKLVQDAADVCEALGLPYRLVQINTADLGFAAAKKYDLEVWAGGCEEWLEVSSASNVTDFQARRANIKFRRAEDGRAEFVHTLNASGLALPRVMIALLENNQQEDGSILIPEVLRPYMGGAERIG
jgi:seryl-tRNA synthetase